jgi:hypothetical protein
VDCSFIPPRFSEEEILGWNIPEGAFFGSDVSSIYVCNNGFNLTFTESTTRQCTLLGPNNRSRCENFTHVGDCASICELDPTGIFYTRCTVDGVQYTPITTRLHPDAVFSCGDGECQLTESCGVTLLPEACADCAACNRPQLGTTTGAVMA